MRAWLLAIVLLLTAAAPPGETLSPAAFRDRLAAAVTALTHKPVTNVDDRTFKTKTSDGTDLTIAIDNAYLSYQADPEHLDETVDRFARILVQPVGDDAAIERLVVIIRPNDYLARTLPPGASTKNFVRGRALAGDLSEYLAVDGADTIRLAGPDDLAKWKLSEAEAWTRAVENIKTRVGDLQPTRLGGENAPSGFGAASGLAPSILADPTICGPGVKSAFEGAVVLVFARDGFLYAVPSDPAMMRSFWDAAKTEVAAGGSMSSTTLTCHGGRWEIASSPGE